jgi:hypothetical protein
MIVRLNEYYLFSQRRSLIDADTNKVIIDRSIKTVFETIRFLVVLLILILLFD